MELAPWLHIAHGCLAAAYHCAGDQVRSSELARQFDRPDGLNFGHAIYYAVAGETDAMFDALEGAYQRRDLHLLSVQQVACFDPTATIRVSKSCCNE